MELKKLICELLDLDLDTPKIAEVKVITPDNAYLKIINLHYNKVQDIVEIQTEQEE